MHINIIPNKISAKLAFLLLSATIFIHPFISEMAYPLLGGHIRMAILSIFFIYLLAGKDFQISGNPFNGPFVLYIISIAVSLFYSINLRSSLHQIYQLIPLLCLFSIVSNLRGKQGNQLVHIMVASASILSIYGIYQYLWGFEHTIEYLTTYLKHMLETRYVQEILLTRRSIATFFSPNMFGAYLAIAIPLTAGLLLKRISEKKFYALHIISLTVMLVALALTKSLSAWISLAFGAVFFLIFIRRFIHRVTLIICVFILIMPVFLLFVRSNMFLNTKNQQNTIVQRLSYWKSSAEIIKDFPLKGVGSGNFENIYPKYKTLLANETRFSHNIFLQTWAETGLLGLISIILLILTFIRISLKAEKSFLNIGLVTSCYIFIINNLLDFSYFIPQVSFLWWISLGLIARKSKQPDNKSDNKIKFFTASIILLLIYLNIRSLVALNYFQRGNYKKAIAAEPYNDLYHAAIGNYNKAIEFNPYSPFHHKNLGLSYLDKGMFKEAISEFEKASLLYPANTSLHQQLFELYKKVGDIEKAEKEEAKIKEFYSKYSGYFIR